MRWRGWRESGNVEDRRGSMPVRAGGVGIGTLLIAVVAGWIFGINPAVLLGVLDGASDVSQQPQATSAAPTDEMGRFVSVVLASTEETWNELMPRTGQRYRPPTLVLFSERTRTACGLGDAAAGPFYCPSDEKIYIDLRFYQTMRQRFAVSGDLAQAYVVAHEVGHHVQNQLGILRDFAAARGRMPQAQYNQLSVRIELQADCFAGVWVHHSQRARNWLESGDIESAMSAAAAVGDDTIQKRTQGVVVPDSFTHGTAAQRMQWFNVGLKSGQIERCDTFGRD